MRQFLTFGAGVVSIVGLVSAACAADLPAAPEAAPTIPGWTGCYLGSHVGGLASQDRTTDKFGQSNGFGSTGFEAGGQIGCDYQFGSGLVAGVEGRAGWSRLDGERRQMVIHS